MGLFKQMELKDSIEINTTPEKIWEFFTNLEKNYKTWHPEDHVIFKWVKGKPMKTGSSWYGEEYVDGKLIKGNGTIGEVIPNRKIVFKSTFPSSIASPGFEWRIEAKGQKSVFTAVSYIRAERIMRLLLKIFHPEYKGMEGLIKIGAKHVKEEGENLKKILESENN
ncbi:MAG: SRPBCC family protein [Candidatus Diapherotrites archaeon]